MGLMTSKRVYENLKMGLVTSKRVYENLKMGRMTSKRVYENLNMGLMNLSLSSGSGSFILCDTYSLMSLGFSHVFIYDFTRMFICCCCN